MSNIKHPDCAIRNLAQNAKGRLAAGNYGKKTGAPDLPPGISPSQKRIYIKLREMIESGEEIVNPIEQLADKEYMQALPHDQRQRYIFELTSDYVAMKRELSLKLAAADKTNNGGGA